MTGKTCTGKADSNDRTPCFPGGQLASKALQSSMVVSEVRVKLNSRISLLIVSQIQMSGFSDKF